MSLGSQPRLKRETTLKGCPLPQTISKLLLRDFSRGVRARVVYF